MPRTRTPTRTGIRARAAVQPGVDARVFASALASVCVAAALLAGCARPAVGSAHDDPRAPVTLTFWHGWSDRGEVKAIDDSIDRFEKLHPDIHVRAVGNVTDTTMNQALRAGGDDAPDVVSSFTTDNVGQYCGSGMWADLDPFMKTVHGGRAVHGLDKAKVFPRTLLKYTSYRGKQCALPLLADAYGLYYNKDAFKKAGISRPPRTMSEFKKDAVRLTERSADGSYRRVGFMPDFRLYQNSPYRLLAQWGPRYFDSHGHARLERDPAAGDYFRTTGALIRAQGGYRALERFRSTFGEEMSSQNAFLKGKLAMHMDGEWRGLMLDKAKAPFHWGTAPLPVPDARAGTYGRGFLTGTIVGIAHSSMHQNAAWELVRFLTADTRQVVRFANAIHNVPSTKAALKSPRLDADPAFRTFIRIASNPYSQALPPTVNGSQYVTSLQDFGYDVEAGKVGDLGKGLHALDRQIDTDLLQARS